MKRAIFDLSAIEDRGGPIIIEDKREMAKLLSRTKPGEDALSLLKSDRLSDLVSVLKRLDRSDSSRDRELHARTEMLLQLVVVTGKGRRLCCKLLLRKKVMI